MPPHIKPIFDKYKTSGVGSLTDEELNFLYLDAMLSGPGLYTPAEKREIRKTNEAKLRGLMDAVNAPFKQASRPAPSAPPASPAAAAGGRVLSSTEEIKDFLAELCPDKDPKGWKRQSKKKDGLNEIREFSHPTGEHLSVVTRASDDTLVKVLQSDGRLMDLPLGSAAGRAAAGSGAEDGPERTYRPDECLFAILEDRVYITPRSYWDSRHALADFIGGHSFAPGVLSGCGVQESELMEAVFPLDAEADEASKLLTAAGFSHSREFKTFLSQSGLDMD